jgi:hypothetical protein
VKSPNDEALTGGAVQGLRENAQIDTATIARPTHRGNALDSLAAHASRRGLELIEISDGYLLGVRLASLHTVANWLRHAGGAW